MIEQLFEIQFRVHLTREHPKYGEFAFGLLIIWLYARDAKSAGDNAATWAAYLPYKIGPGKSFPIAEQAQLLPYQVDCIKHAQIIGRNLAVFTWPKGTDENQALGTWPGLCLS